MSVTFGKLHMWENYTRTNLGNYIILEKIVPHLGNYVQKFWEVILTSRKY